MSRVAAATKLKPKGNEKLVGSPHPLTGKRRVWRAGEAPIHVKGSKLNPRREVIIVKKIPGFRGLLHKITVGALLTAGMDPYVVAKYKGRKITKLRGQVIDDRTKAKAYRRSIVG